VSGLADAVIVTGRNAEGALVLFVPADRVDEFLASVDE
jgi:hypothetical protein